MAVTSPLAPLSPPRAVGRGNLCAVVMPRRNLHVLTQGQKYMTRHTHLQYIDTKAQAYAASVVAAAQTLSNSAKNTQP